MDTIWLAEAYPWWRKHGMEARSSTGVGALMARETERLTIGWGIIAASTRHPVQAAMDARVVQEAAGPGRFILGFGTSKIFLNNTKTQTKKTLGPMRDAVTIARGRSLRRALRLRRRHVERRRAGARRRRARAARGAAGLRRRDRAEDAAARGRDRRRLPHAFDHDARLRPLHAENVGGEIDVGCTSSPRSTRATATQAAMAPREIAGMYLANKVQNIQGAADTLLELAGIEQDEIRPVAEAMEQGWGASRRRPRCRTRSSTSARPIAGTPSDCIEAIEEVPRRRLTPT
jgi:hypothetical protein